MKSTSLLIAIAALAVTASSAQAFSGTALREAGLSENQVAAFVIARELSREGDTEKARDVLLEAGIDEEAIDKLRRALHQHRDSHRETVATAKKATNFTDFRAAVAGSPLADIVTTEEEFQTFKANQAKRKWTRELHRVNQQTDNLSEAQIMAIHAAEQANDKKAVHAIKEEAGIVSPSLERQWQQIMKPRAFTQ